MRTFTSAADFVGAAGSDLGHTEWRTITQERIDAFAEATDDHQWIHVDRERAATGPFRSTIAHGFLTLSLIPSLLHEIYTVSGASMVVNYGLERVRFPAPLPSGSELRARAVLKSANADDGRVRLITEVTVEGRDTAKPFCVAEVVSLVVFS